MKCKVFLEDNKMDGEVFRSLIATDGEGQWWQDAVDGSGLLLKAGDHSLLDLVEVMKNRKLDFAADWLQLAMEVNHLTAEKVVDFYRKNGEEIRNPAWDRFLTLEEAEEHEVGVTGGSMEDYSFRVVLE